MLLYAQQALHMLYCSAVFSLLITLWWMNDVEMFSWIPYKWDTTSWIKSQLRTDEQLMRNGKMIGVLNCILLITCFLSGFYWGVVIAIVSLLFIITGLLILSAHSSAKKYSLKKRRHSSR